LLEDTTYLINGKLTRLKSNQIAKLFVMESTLAKLAVKSLFTPILEMQKYSNVHNAIRTLIEISMQLGILY